MTLDTELNQLILNKMTPEQFAEAKANGSLSSTELYLVDDGQVGGATGDYIPSPASAEVGQTIVVKAVDANGKPTEWEAKDLPGGGGGASEWTKLGDETVTQTYEFTPLSFTGGVVTLDTTAPGYDFMNKNVNVVVHPIDPTSTAGATLYQLRPTDYSAGTFDVYNGDGVKQSSAAMDMSVYKISVMNVKSVSMTDIPDYDRYKVRISTPVMATHGIRAIVNGIDGKSSFLAFNAIRVFAKTGGVIMETELFTIPGNKDYMMRKTTIAYGKYYGGNENSTLEGVEVVPVGAGQTKPANGLVRWTATYCPFVNGTRFELWGANDV